MQECLRAVHSTKLNWPARERERLCSQRNATGAHTHTHNRILDTNTRTHTHTHALQASRRAVTSEIERTAVCRKRNKERVREIARGQAGQPSSPSLHLFRSPSLLTHQRRRRHFFILDSKSLALALPRPRRRTWNYSATSSRLSNYGTRRLGLRNSNCLLGPNKCNQHSQRTGHRVMQILRSPLSNYFQVMLF